MTTLDQILAHTRLQVEERKLLTDVPALERRALAYQPRGFERALRLRAATGPAIIAEIKKASPSRGLIREDFRPQDLGPELQSAGAAALSVLTDTKFFQGSLSDLEAVSAVVGVPCLRKDFILDPFQILEARAAGADAILLIVAALSDRELKTLHMAATDLNLDVLVEAHDRPEIDRAIQSGAQIIGVNSRDLRDFTVKSESLLVIADALPPGVLRVAESGIRTAEDITNLRSGGYHAFLIGEALMRQREPGAALAQLLAVQTPQGM